MRLLLFIFLISTILISCSTSKKETKVLVFSKTMGYRHASIEPGLEAIKKLGSENGFVVNHTEDASKINQKNLEQYNAVIFLHTTGNIFDDEQEYEFMRYYQAGGGFVGIHAAADTEYDWPWYGDLVGAYFESHPNDPNVRNADIQILEPGHESCSHLKEVWNKDDEWYNYKNINPEMTVLLNLDENSYEGGTNGESHPIAWTREHMFYTGLGHTAESFENETFLKHLLGGIKSVLGSGPDYTAEAVAPALNRFQKDVFDQNLDEPMELAVLPNDNIMFIERSGNVKYFDQEKKNTKLINKLEVHTEHEDGLLGLTIDPNFKSNNWIYLFYSPKIEKAVQYVSRFDFKDGKLDLDSEKIILQIPVQREQCCHSAGSIEFDGQGNLLIAVGDNTNPHESSGYSPSDGRLGRKPFDARRSSANTNDLRGKILRIRPTDDGTYTIPEGNLFTSSDSTKAEIYVMGCRNPYRFFVDAKTNFLYWGDVGPDAGEDKSDRGPRGYDEVNQAREAGFFGWPLFVGDNEAYNAFDFANERSGERHEPEMPINTSPNNTGKTKLPPANGAYIYYPYAGSEEFPLLGNGGRNAMAGFVYHYDDYPESDFKLPKYYDGKLFTYDWMRGWIMAVTMDENGDYVSMERFLPNHKFSNPTDIIMNSDGKIYLLEYGTAWFSQNEDARLVHLRFSNGNRPPSPEIITEKTIGAAPLLATFDASTSKDYDGDALAYAWYVEGRKVGSKAILEYNFDEAGKYLVRLEATDKKGGIAEKEVLMLVGNEKPEISISIEGNRSFYFDNEPLNYKVDVTDKEDGKIGQGIDPGSVAINIDYLENGFDRNEIAMGHMSAIASHPGFKEMQDSDCYTCHKDNATSIGPSFLKVADKYKDQGDAIAYLSERIIKGGGGVWGENAMAAHPQLDEDQANLMVEYILELEDEEDKEKLPYEGSYSFIIPEGKEPGGTFVMNASYLDKGSEKTDPISSTETILLRSANLSALDYNDQAETKKITIEPGQVPGITESMTLLMANNESFLLYEDLDFTSVNKLTITSSVNQMFMAGGKIELVLDTYEGEAFATLSPGFTSMIEQNFDEVDISKIGGLHDLYLRFKSNADGKPVLIINQLIFSK